MEKMTKEEFNKLLSTLNLECTEDQYQKLNDYLNFLLEYNTHTNLTSITNINEIFLKHFYDSLTITKVINLNNINTLLDIGSGAGFPGIVLKIFYPNLNITLLDSNNKKITFLNELIKKLKLANINTINIRVEDFAKNNLNKYDLVTARAVTNLRVLSEISLPLVKINSYFIAMKGNISEELPESESTIKIMNGYIETIEKFKLPIELSDRTLIKIKKTSVTTINMLRPYNKILKCKLTI